ncbi:cuticle protein AMP4-like [Macrobrachium rosenbergii]|uniref:cuticle protein AMP4-like n=1 Tax=Macrobrachium rosenbergii TaxID=79674 RepID=UPI0034D64BF6
MKFIVFVSCLVAFALAAPQGDDRDRLANILRDDRVDNGDGSFSYAFASDNGLEMEVAGTPGSEGQSNMQGYYLLPLADGGFARITFIADENGFQPQGDILPTPHPLPAHAIEQIRIAEQQRAAGITFE